jgi:hypothetical protein
VEVIAQHVWLQGDRVVKDLEVAVTPDQLVIDPQVEGIAAEALVPVDADERVCRRSDDEEREAEEP